MARTADTKVCECCGERFKVFPSTVERRRFCDAECSAKFRASNERARFWGHVEKGDGCWLWKSMTNALGYGVFSLSGPGTMLAHRYSFETTNGKIPAGMIICHRCDVPSCVRPEHLYAGTHLDNTHDKMARGRDIVKRGEAHGMAILTTEQVREIRRRYGPPRGRGYATRNQTPSAAELGKEFGVKAATIVAIVGRRIWKHVD